jgi:hypothetical protein
MLKAECVEKIFREEPPLNLSLREPSLNLSLREPSRNLSLRGARQCDEATFSLRRLLRSGACPEPCPELAEGLSKERSQ